MKKVIDKAEALSIFFCEEISIEFVLVAFCRLLVSIVSIMLKILFTKKQKNIYRKLPKLHNMLHSQTDNGNSNPAGSTEKKWLSARFY